MILNQDFGGLGAPVFLPRRGQGSLLVYPGRLRALMGNPLADCQAILILVDPDRRRLPQVAILRSIFKLSDAEARLATLLVSGASIEVATEKLAFSPLTARTQLSAAVIFQV